jgi:hypothetical protein
VWLCGVYMPVRGFVCCRRVCQAYVTSSAFHTPEDISPHWFFHHDAFRSCVLLPWHAEAAACFFLLPLLTIKSPAAAYVAQVC